MKRLRVILLFLLLGAIINVVVAWGFALFRNPFIDSSHTIAYEITWSNYGGSWVLERWERMGILVLRNMNSLSESAEDIESTSPEPTSLVPRWAVISDRVIGDSEDNRWIIGVGWPLVALKCEFKLPDGARITNANGIIVIPTFNWQNPDYGDQIPRGLPYWLVWRGFIVNTIFYAAILWLLFPGQRALRRFIRRKRGFCVKCSYDLQGAEHEACPECGEEVRKANPA